MDKKRRELKIKEAKGSITLFFVALGTILIVLLTLFATLIFTGGCVSRTVNPVPSSGIPNLYVIDKQNNIWRGAQPTERGWDFLRHNGVTNVLKLNTEKEGSDDYAESIGMVVYRWPINLWQQWFGDVDLINTVSAVRPGMFIHCGSDDRTMSSVSAVNNDQGGQDRTGLVVGALRVWQYHWPKDKARREMLNIGFHKSIIGLEEKWQSLKPCQETKTK
jgi:hypothetical protein